MGIVLLAGWQKRFMADDAFINFRVVDQVLAGYGPVFKAGERVEAFTSPAWLWLLVAGKALSGWATSISQLAVLLGLLLTGVAIGLAELAGLQLLERTPRSRGGRPPTFMVPLGALVIASWPPLWHWATSGLDTALLLAWLGVSALLLARTLRVEGRPHRLWLTAVVVGSGWLVRPDAVVYSAAFLAALVWVARPPWRRALGLVAVGLAPSMLYQVFRMGYYASLLPNTALAKEAGQSSWEIGWIYVRDSVGLPAGWLVLGLIGAAVVLQLRQLMDVRSSGESHRPGERDTAARESSCVLWVTVGPIAAAALHVVWVIRVGGDYLPARFLVGDLFVLVLPISVVSLPTRWRPLTAESMCAVVVAVLLVGWSLVQLAGGGAWRADQPGDDPEYVFLGTSTNALEPEDYPLLAGYGHDMAQRAAARRDELVMTTLFRNKALPRPPGTGTVGFFGSIGVGAYTAGTDVWIVDQHGLADPLGARSGIAEGAVAGHQKFLADDIVKARFAAPAADDSDSVVAWRSAMGCGELNELIAATNDELSFGRFLENMVAAPSLTALRLPDTGEEARRRFCSSA